MKLMRTALTVCTAAVLAFAGCSSDSDTGGEGGSTNTGGSGGTGPGTTTGTGSGTTTGTGTGTGSDTNNSCAEAEDLAPDPNASNVVTGSGIINPAGDSDYFKFTAQAGDWISISTTANPDDEIDWVDTVITLYDEAGNVQIAEADDQSPRVSTDSELYYRVETTGTYCLRVWEFSEWYGENHGGMTPEGDPTFAYEVDVATILFDQLDAYNLDTEANDSVAAAQGPLSYFPVTSPDNNEMMFTNLAGMLEPGTDVDVYALDAPVGAVTMSIDFTPAGPAGYGSTKGPGLVTLLDSDGTTVLARLDNQQGAPGGLSSVPIADGATYYLQVERPDTNVGSNDFYFLKTNSWDAMNPQEVEPNDTNATATATEPVDNTTVISHFIGGTITPGDVDWWSLNLADGDTVSVICSSARAGSGARGVEFAIMSDPNDGSPKAEVETLDADVYWSDLADDASQPAFQVTTGGLFYFRITGGTQDATVTSNHYLCGIHAAAP